MLGRLGVLVVVVAVLGCGGHGRSATDAAPGDTHSVGDGNAVEDAACSSNVGGFDTCTQYGFRCRNGRCVPVCEGIDGGTVCGGGPDPNEPYVCCTPAERCCETAGETSACVALDQPCPHVCEMTWQCSASEWCTYCQTCGAPTVPGCDGPPINCASDCPPDQRCNAFFCCGTNTTCIEGWCQETCPGDAGTDGLPDAAPGDGPADAGTD